MQIKDGTALLVENALETLTESKVQTINDEKKYVIEGVFMQSERKNKNNRIYPESIMDKEVNRYITEYVNSNRAVGELNHPSGDPAINYERVSHKITKLVKEGTNWIGTATITKNTPMGSIVAGLMDEGVQLGVSSRALGTVKLDLNRTKIVQPDFRLITPADIVADPSAPDALVTNIMENSEWVFMNGSLTEQAVEDIQLVVNDVSKRSTINEQNLLNIYTWIINKKIGVK